MFNPDSFNLNATVTSIVSVLSRTTSLTTSAIDMAAFRSGLSFTLDAGAATAGTLPTLATKIQDSADGSTGWADLVTFGGVTDAGSITQHIGVAAGKHKRYIRAVGTIGGTVSPAFAYGITALGVSE